MSENQEFFRETADRIFSDTVGTAEIMAATKRGIPHRMFAALSENGILSMLAPESAGGIGASLAEAMTIMRSAGEAAAPGPLLETLLANGLLGLAGQELGQGPITLALLPDGLADETAPSLHVAPWASHVDAILMVAPSQDGSRIAMIPTSQLRITHGTDAADEPSDLFGYEADVSTNWLSIDIPFAQILRQAAILRGGQMLGAMEWAFRRSVDYAMERKQFGKEIGKFQVVQQMLAELADHVLAATMLLEAAAEEGSDMMTAAARSRLADASDCTISVAHQVHGAIGFSLEYSLNHRTRRLMAWRDTYGSVPFWRRSVGLALVGHDRETLWHGLTGTP